MTSSKDKTYLPVSCAPGHSSPPFALPRQSVWKVLVYDKACQDILAPVLSVGELRKLGITLHMLIDQKRERVPDVPAVYFVRPTAENVQQICADCAAGLYDSFHLNFSSSLPRPLLEKLAQETLQSNTAARVARVFDQYCDFVTPEPSLISLNIPDSYVKCNSQRLSDDQIMSYVDAVVESLFCLVVTMGTVPVIQCPPEGAAEMVASNLSKKLRSHLMSKNNLFAGGAAAGGSFHRPLLVLLDRNVDLAVPLHHTWTYQALCHDLLGMRSNRITVEIEGKKKTYDLGAEDAFWRGNAGKPFPKVAEAVEAQLQAYQQDMNEINQKTGQKNHANIDGGNADLQAAIGVLPEMEKKKKELDKHTNIATAILRQLKQRELDACFSWEEELITKGVVDKKELARLMGSQGKSVLQDKLRMLLIYYLCADVGEAELAGLCKQLLEPDAASAGDEEQKDAAPVASEADLAALYVTGTSGRRA